MLQPSLTPRRGRHVPSIVTILAFLFSIGPAGGYECPKLLTPWAATVEKYENHQKEQGDPYDHKKTIESIHAG